MTGPRVGLAVFLGLVVGQWSARPVLAVEEIGALAASLATESAIASSSALEATSAAKLVVERVVEKKPDITETQGVIKGKLERYLEEQVVGPWSPLNFLQHGIREAVRQGVPANTIVLVLLFPVVTAIIAASRHLIGLRGFGIFVPAMLSVAFVATGMVAGIVMFLAILFLATTGRQLVKRFKLQYLPRMALLLWLVAVGVLGVLVVSPLIKFVALANVNIFSILILILLAENFIEVQYGKSPREARELTVETIILALISSLVLSLEVLQRFALIHPEALLLLVAIFDVFLGRYVGLRWNEYRKFKKLVS